MDNFTFGMFSEMDDYNAREEAAREGYVPMTDDQGRVWEVSEVAESDDDRDSWDDGDDGQPDEYTEWQDVYGGDDWDHGQYDGDW